MKRQFRSVLIGGMLAALGPLAGVGIAAQYNSSNNNARNVNPSNDTANNVSSADRTFARNAAQGGLAEVKMGELAQKNASSQAVKDFGQRMVTNHTKANGELTLEAAKENIQLPTQMNSTDQSTYDKLSKLTGPAFDRAYTRDMVNDHQKDIADFQKEAKSGSNATIRQFAANTTPILQEHLKLAQEMQNQVSQTSSKRTNTANKPS